MTLEKVLQALYDSEINVKIEWLWDGGFDVELDGPGAHHPKNFDKASEIGPWLVSSAKFLFPNSKFAKEWKD